jgi:hypothetical protein
MTMISFRRIVDFLMDIRWLTRDVNEGYKMTSEVKNIQLIVEYSAKFRGIL